MHYITVELLKVLSKEKMEHIWQDMLIDIEKEEHFMIRI